MTREEAIKRFKTLLLHVDTDCVMGMETTEAINMAIKALEQSEPCEDVVSRAEILRMINCINDHHAITPYKSVGAVTEHLTRIASNLPPVTPKQRIGKWIPVDSYTAYGGDEVTWMAHGNPVAFYYCSECKEHAYAGEDGEDILSKFCPHCGAKMKGTNNADTKF